jgi:hypothetical protein
MTDEDKTQESTQEQSEGSAPAEPVGTEAALPEPPPPPPPPAETALPEPPPPATAPVGGLSHTQKTADERKALLANTLQGQVARGGRIESQGDFQAVVVTGHRTNHLLHFFIGLFTLGVWWIVWFFIAIFGGEKRQMITVDDLGNTFVQKV